MTSLRDAQGCLTPSGFDVLAQAAVGQAPPELAQHVAACGRCQDRMLAGARVELRGGAKATPPPAWRIWAVLGAALFVLLSILATLKRLG